MKGNKNLETRHTIVVCCIRKLLFINGKKRNILKRNISRFADVYLFFFFWKRFMFYLFSLIPFSPFIRLDIKSCYNIYDIKSYRNFEIYSRLSV